MISSNRMENEMNTRLSKIMAGFFVCFAIMMMSNIKVNAANANVSVSSASGSVGDTITVDVTVKPEVAALAQIAVAYDTNYLECVGGGNGGSAGLVMDILDIAEGATGKMTISFRLKKAGTTAVSISSTSTSIAATSDDSALNINKTDGSVTIKAASAASNDSRLSGLVVQAVSQDGSSQTVSYTPSFSSDVYDYKADLPANTVKLVIATTLSDSNSTTKVSGTRIDPGDNKTTITVVAEDGSQSKYTLYTTRPKESSTDNTETSAEVSSELQTTDFDRSPKLISSINKYIIQDFSLVSIPEGFEESSTTFNGETVAAVRGIAKGLTLLCLADDTQGSNAEFYIYNEVSGAIDKMVNITLSQKIYTIIPTGDEYVGPNGYSKTELDINGEKVNAWVKSADSEFYVVYAMNWNGEKALYMYDTKEQTMQRFVDGNKSESLEDEPEEENKEYLAMKKRYDVMYEEYVNDHSKKNKIIIALLAVLLCSVVGIITLIYKIRRKNTAHSGEELEEIGSEQEEKELKLDMVAQVNEMKAEKLAQQIGKIMDDTANDFVNDNDSAYEELQSNEVEDANNMLDDTTKNNKNVTDSTEKSDILMSDEDVKAVASDKSSGSDDDESYLINMEDDDPFEIEFVDLNDGNDEK